MVRSRRAGAATATRAAAPAIVIIVAIAFAVLAPIVAKLIQLAISRQREYPRRRVGRAPLPQPRRARPRAREDLGDPEPLEVANKATAHLYISNPLKEHASLLNNLFSTHPPIEERIRLLRAM